MSPFKKLSSFNLVNSTYTVGKCVAFTYFRLFKVKNALLLFNAIPIVQSMLLTTYGAVKSSM